MAVENLATGATFTAGATSGMMCASVAKVQILESLLVQNNGPLTGDADDLATRMIEHSDNDAADALYGRLGGADDFTEYMTRLGMSSPATIPGPPYYWGLTTTSAMQHLTLMKNLAGTPSPLTAGRAVLHARPDAQRRGRPALGRARGGRCRHDRGQQERMAEHHRRRQPVGGEQ